MILLLLVSIIPCLLIFVFIIRKDKYEPEPSGFLTKIFFLGALSCFPAVILEMALSKLPVFGLGNITGAAIDSFLMIAPIEELMKFLVVMIFVWKNKNFNEENDGIVYSAAAAIGFAMFENIFYVFDYGVSIGVLRAVTAIPLHSFSGVIMGYYIGAAKFSEDPKCVKRLLFKGLLFAYLFHAVYDTFALSESVFAVLIIPLLIILIFMGWKFLKKGELLSSKRWSVESSDSAITEKIADDPATAELTKRVSSGKWKRNLAIAIMTPVIIFWTLIFIGILADDTVNTDYTEVVITLISVTMIPILLSFFLVKSYKNISTGKTI